MEVKVHRPDARRRQATTRSSHASAVLVSALDPGAAWTCVRSCVRACVCLCNVEQKGWGARHTSTRQEHPASRQKAGGTPPPLPHYSFPLYPSRKQAEHAPHSPVSAASSRVPNDWRSSWPSTPAAAMSSKTAPTQSQKTPPIDKHDRSTLAAYNRRCDILTLVAPWARARSVGRPVASPTHHRIKWKRAGGGFRTCLADRSPSRTAENTLRTSSCGARTGAGCFFGGGGGSFSTATQANTSVTWQPIAKQVNVDTPHRHRQCLRLQ